MLTHTHTWTGYNSKKQIAYFPAKKKTTFSQKINLFLFELYSTLTFVIKITAT